MSETGGSEPGFGNQRVREIYRDGMYDGETPAYPIAYEDLREAGARVRPRRLRNRGDLSPEHGLLGPPDRATDAPRRRGS